MHWPLTNTADTKQSSGASDPSAELKVIGAGLGRTGTTSLQEALCILGFGPCHHMSSLFQDPTRSETFCRAYDGETVDWRTFMAGYNSTIDQPTSEFVPELMAAFPNALVILSVRDSAEIWFRSCIDTIFHMGSLGYQLSVFPIPYLRKHVQVGRRIKARWARQGLIAAPALYNVHNAFIREIVPKEKLLEYNVKQGWGPLCEFLGVPVPDVPFPRKNETAAMKNDIRTGMLMGQAVWATGFAVAGVLIHQAMKRKVWTWLGPLW